MDRTAFLDALQRAGYDVDQGPPDARLLLDQALDALDEIERLRAELDVAEHLTALSERGNLRASPLLNELRQHRAALARLLTVLFPDDDSPTTRRARAAANARWAATP